MNEFGESVWDENQEIWNYIEEVLSNQRGLKDLGFESRDEVKNIWVILVGGDLVHPELGPDYIRMKDDKSNHKKVYREANRRDRLVNELVNEIISRIKEGDFESAESVTDTPSKVIYICRDMEETKQAIDAMNELGIFRSSIVDTDLQSFSSGLIFVYGEEYTHFDYSGCD